MNYRPTHGVLQHRIPLANTYCCNLRKHAVHCYYQTELLLSPVNRTATKHSVEYFIAITGQLDTQSVQQLYPERLRIAKDEFKLMGELSYALPSTNP